MSDILHSEGRADPSASRSSPARDASRPPADDEPEATAPSPWQAAMMRVTIVVAIWLGY